MFKEDLFKGKTVLVTGGGSGIGYSIAENFLEHGAKVIIASRKVEKLNTALEKLQKIGDCSFVEINIRDVEGVEKVANTLKSDVGTIDILINNAGGQFPSPAEKISPNGWRAVIDTNLNGTWNMIHSFAQTFFIPQKAGVIVNIIANIRRGFPGMAHTGAARAGVENLTKSLSVEWVNHNIRLNAIAPGIINSVGLERYPPQFRAAMEPSIPMKRLGTVEDIAYMTLFLSSPMANYVIGETIYIDGGQSLWGSMWDIN